jgi:chromosome segregation protein
MRLKAIALKGFKSFPERTVLEFGPGVSVIVGPNGSGKSNITDAVLWALGEQSPGAVRGQSMQDVIFSGAPARQASTRAEVELVLDDSEGVLGLGTPEVSILRRLDRAGEGEYRLAGARCRLIDVIEVLSDTGLGKEMHSVISQGRVESIVTSKPRDRRALIEEAAGLGKHRKRRRRAQLKLERTQHNLDRALDVEREARARLRPLKRQAEAADLHARLERQVLETRWELARDTARERRAGLAAAEREVAALRGKREAVERELEGVSRDREAAEDALSDRSARREELSRRWFAARAAAERIEDRVETVAAAVAVIEARIARGRERSHALHSEVERDEDDGRIGERIAALEAELARAEREREAELAGEVAALERDRAAAARTAGEREQEVSAALAARRAVEQRLEKARSELGAAERRVEGARREAARVGSELAEVNRSLRGLEGAAGAGATLADGLSVEPGYELALAAALDGRLRAALAPDRAAAGRLLDRSVGEGGRVIVAGSVSEVPPVEPPSRNATPLADRVGGEGEAVTIVRRLLRDTWVLQSLEDVSAGFEGVAVTLGGRAWSARTGELRQVPAVGDEHMLAERNRRGQLLRATEQAAQEEASARGAREQAAAELERLQDERDAALAAYRHAGRTRDEASEREREIAAAIQRRKTGTAAAGPAGARLAQVTLELESERRARERVGRGRLQREQAIARLEAAVVADERALPAVRLAVEALRGAASAIPMQAQRFEQELEADRQAGEEIAARLRACAQREAGLQAQLHLENEALTHAEVGAQRARDRAEEGDADLGALAARLELAADPASEPLSTEERDGLGQRLERLARRREQLGPVNPLAEAEYAEAVEHVEELEHQRRDLETALRELETVIRDTDKQIDECFEQTFTATAQNFEEVVSRLFPGGTGRLRLVAERDGPARLLGGQQAASDESPEEGQPEPEALGIEIELMPAGKRMQRLSLLSGGEKSLTALAFLFAVFLARPCPFYILDEVEAALDDINIDRFLELLRSYADRAQFIVVTHQKRTMEAADVLYGVVMGGDGITKVISRRLPAAEAA